MSQGKTRLGQLMAIFTLSGFSGLIYQSIWSHYLGLTLGHAAYAQTLVLAIFMGGLALGSWYASRWVRTLGNAVRAYAFVELVIGVFALVFHPLFLAYTGYSQDVVLPSLSPGMVHAYQWGSAALLILPQCVLLGTTFPLIASACIRIERDAQGWSLGGLYFSNSLGAAIGALVATFVLLPWIGMPGAMTLAGVVNVVVAALAWSLSRTEAGVAAAPAAVQAPEAPAANRRLLRGVLVAAAITGGTSFVYEVVWVRMLNMALGTTLHSFELMLAAFILGLAAGGYWIHRRGDSTPNTLWLAGVSQVLMGLFALASVLAFSQSFHWVGWMVRELPHTDAGYDWFNFGSATVAMLVMFPAAFFAGSTLPLFTMSLLRKGEGERAIGWVYAANTLGAIVGVFAVVHLLIPLLGLHLSLLLAAVMDVALGVVLLALFGEARAERDKRVALLAGVVMLTVAMLYGRPDPLVASSGVYRTGYLLGKQDAKIRFLADGKTATVAVIESLEGDAMSIATNGKPDAGMAPSLALAPLGDEVTMMMAAALPLSMHPAPREVGLIGWGSGLTTHTMLGSPQVQRLETIEIEPVMVRGARSFGARVARGYEDPRSAIVYEDARTYLSAGRRHYDVLVSEPSNPWVSGVASLFTEEFYGFATRHLNRGGLFVQWIHSYEMTDHLQSRMIAALLKNFPHAEVYLTNSSDLLIVASKDELPAPDFGRLQTSPLREELGRLGLHDDVGFSVRRIGGRKVLEAYTSMFDAHGHSDFYPVVALGGPRARFLRESATLLPLLVQNGMPVLDLVDARRPPPHAQLSAEDNVSSFVAFERFGTQIGEAMQDPALLEPLHEHWPQEVREIVRLRELSSARVEAKDLAEWSTNLAALSDFGPGARPPEDLVGSWIDPRWLAPGQGAEVQSVMAAYRAASLRDAAQMRTTGVTVLDLKAPLAAHMREQMLLIAMAGAAGQRDFKGVQALDYKYAPGMANDDDYAQIRRFLVAWAKLSGGEKWH